MYRRALAMIMNFYLFVLQKNNTEVVNVVNAALRKKENVVNQKKVVQKPDPETVIVISSDDESDKGKFVSRRRKGVELKAFSSVLSARSKVCSN